MSANPAPGPDPAGDRIPPADDRTAQEPPLRVVEEDRTATGPDDSAHDRKDDRTHGRRDDRGRDVPEGPLGLLADAAWQTVLLAGLAAVALGVITLAWPRETLVVVGVLFGIYLVVSGVLQLVAAFGTHGSTALRVMAFISGALCILLGLLCFRSALQSILLLALWIGIGWLFRGITQAVAASTDEDMPARGWQGFLGVVSALAGIVLIVSPFSSIGILTLLAGCWLIAVGVVEIVTAFRIRGRAKHIPRGA